MKSPLLFVFGAAFIFNISTPLNVYADTDMAPVFAKDCARCHGRKGKGMASFPSIAGQTSEHIETRLKQYRAKEKVGPNSALMFPVAEKLTDEDISSLATFISTTFK